MGGTTEGSTAAWLRLRSAREQAQTATSTASEQQIPSPESSASWRKDWTKTVSPAAPIPSALAATETGKTPRDGARSKRPCRAAQRSAAQKVPSKASGISGDPLSP